jgi:hypothetical protein
VYFLARSRRPRLSDQRGLRNGADVQIGGGVRVGDAFKASAGYDLIAIWGTWFCVEISQARHSCLARFKEERYAQPTDKREGEAGVGGGLKTSGLRGTA